MAKVNGGSTAAEGFAGGFFGCFGVGAAVVAMLLALSLCSHGVSPVVSGKSPYLAICQLAVNTARGRSKALAAARSDPDGEVSELSNGATPVIACPILDAASNSGFVTVRVQCADPVAACFSLMGGMVDGEAIDLGPSS